MRKNGNERKLCITCYIYSIQYIDNSETPFNIRLNNHRKKVKDPNAILQSFSNYL